MNCKHSTKKQKVYDISLDDDITKSSGVLTVARLDISRYNTVKTEKESFTRVSGKGPIGILAELVEKLNKK